MRISVEGGEEKGRGAKELFPGASVTPVYTHVPFNESQVVASAEE